MINTRIRRLIRNANGHSSVAIFLVILIAALTSVTIGADDGVTKDDTNPRGDLLGDRPADSTPNLPALDSNTERNSKPTIDAHPPKSINVNEVKGWVQRLSDDSYLRRESAAKKLIEAGPEAVPYITPALESGELETTLSVIHVLREMALKQSPDNAFGAWEKLVHLSENGAGSRQTRSAAAVEEIREYRSRQAVEFLENAGVYIGHADFIVRAISHQKPIIQIDENWNGDIAALRWLRWLRGIEFARIKGPAIRKDVLEKLGATVDLTTIAIVEGKVEPSMLEPLKRMDRIDSIEFRYVDLKGMPAKPLADLPIRKSLSLTGTGIPKASVKELRKTLPGLQIDCKEGGFLGVTCQSGSSSCQILTVVPGSAADKAGLMSGDIVIGIDDEPVSKFEDLQQEIGMHFPGDEVSVRFRRVHEHKLAKVKLGKLEER